MMATPAAVLNILVTANTVGAVARLRAVDSQMATTSGKSTAMGRALNAAGKAAAIGTGLVAAGAVKMATDFDKSMRNVNSIAQLPERQLKSLEKQVLALAGKTAQAPKTLAEGLYDLVSSGFDSKESMLVLESSAKAATAGLTDTATSTKAVAAVLNAYRKPASAAAEVSDQLFQTVNVGVITFEELSQTIGDVLPFAAQLSVGLDQVGASVATMTKSGISPAETMTRIKAVMVSLIKPGDDLAKAIKATGFESGEALIKQKGFQGALDTLIKTTDGSKGAVAGLFPNIRALAGALALTGQNSRGANTDLKAFGDTSGATNTALAEQSKSLAFQWQKLRAQVSALLIELGMKFLPTLISVTGWVARHKGVLKTLAGVLAVAAAAWVGYRVAALAAGVATAFATGGLSLIIPLVFALAAALVIAYTKFGTFRAIVDAVARTLRNGLLGALSAVLGGLSSFLSAIASAARAVGADGLANKAQAGANAINRLRDSLNNAKDKSTEATRNLDLFRRSINELPDRKSVNIVANVSVKESQQNKADQFNDFGKSRGDGPGQAVRRAVGGGVQRVANKAARNFIPGIGALPSGKGAGSLMGAGKHMAPFAAIGARFGLRVSSGLRPGAVTSSGKPSHHASGNALDLAGSPAAMMQAFRVLQGHAGQLAELIYTPGGAYSNGQKYTPSGQLAADHYDHIHVAYRGGSGDGRGRMAGVGGGQAAVIAAAAKRHGIDPAILWGLFGAESNFGKNLGPSSAGARGPFQFMPQTAKAYGIDPMDFKAAANAAAKYLATYKERGTAGMLLAYNAGPAGKMNPESAAYIPKVKKLAKTWPGAKGTSKTGSTTSSTAAERVNPLDQKLANADVAIEQAKRGTIKVGNRKISSALQQVAALTGKRQVIGKRIRSIRQALKGKKLSKAKRLALTQELSQRLGEHAQLGADVKELRNPAASVDTGLGAGGAIAGGDFGDGVDPNQALIDALQAAADAAQKQTEAINEHNTLIAANNAEIKKQTDFATAVTNTSNYQLTKSLADVLSGHIVGYGVAGRRMTPGTGVEVAF